MGGAGDQGAELGQGADGRAVDSDGDAGVAGSSAQREARGNVGCQRRLPGTHHVREGRGTEVSVKDLVIYCFDVRPGGPRDGGHEGTADCGPEGVLRVHRGRVQGVGADEARVQLIEEAGNGPRAAVDEGVLETEGFGSGGPWC